MSIDRWSKSLSVNVLTWGRSVCVCVCVCVWIRTAIAILRTPGRWMLLCGSTAVVLIDAVHHYLNDSGAPVAPEEMSQLFSHTGSNSWSPIRLQWQRWSLDPFFSSTVTAAGLVKWSSDRNGTRDSKTSDRNGTRDSKRTYTPTHRIYKKKEI